MRIFVAVNLTEEAQNKVYLGTAAIRVPESGIRWVSPHLFHVTVKFLGEVGDEKLPTIQQAMDDTSVKFHPFAMDYGELGVFPGGSRPKTIWMGCGYQATLELIQHELATHFAELGFEPEGRRFSPHVTLGRVKRNADQSDLDGLLQTLDEIEFNVSDHVASIDLMASKRTSGMSSYECIHRSKLGVV